MHKHQPISRLFQISMKETSLSSNSFLSGSYLTSSVQITMQHHALLSFSPNFFTTSIPTFLFPVPSCTGSLLNVCHIVLDLISFFYILFASGDSKPHIRKSRDELFLSPYNSNKKKKKVESTKYLDVCIHIY